MKLFLSIILAMTLLCQQSRQALWPKGQMPDSQEHQIAAMTDESEAEGFNANKHRMPFIEWFPAPENPNGGCMILIPGGSYINTCDVNLMSVWGKRLTELGFQCVKLVYRTPRPVGLPIYQSAWEDGQRAVRVVRNEASKRGFDPERIGAISMSAGSHLNLLLATSSQTQAYSPIDAIDEVPCHLNWAIVDAPAYVLNDSEDGTPNIRQGIGSGIEISSIFKFDEKTCPMSLHHGGTDIYSPFASSLVYRELRRRNIPAELHIYPNRGHGAYGLDESVEFLAQLGILGPLEPEVELMQRYDSDSARAEHRVEDIWPEGRVPDFRQNQNKPYIEWHIPAERTTDAIQIIYSGGSYEGNAPDGFEVAPVRRYLNSLGMTVVTLKYRTPRPEGLPKHITAWQDLQRAIKIVRSEAASLNLNPDKIGIMGSSAGGHLTLMGVTSSLQQSYRAIDEIDALPCNVQWGIGIYPAYVLTDGANDVNSEKGNADDNIIVPEFNFDLKTAPMLFLHGDADCYSAMGSVKVWERMAAMGIQSELHTLVGRDHCFQRVASPNTASYNFNEKIKTFLVEMGVL